MANKTIGLCALCKQNKELQLSHIIPNFVSRKMKKTSIGNMRNSSEPNKVIQDIEKHYMLCHECEERFSAIEKYFANKIFNPWIDSKQIELEYDKKLTEFIISLSWRRLNLELKHFSCDGTFNKEILNTLLEAENIMKNYLLGTRQDIADIQNHIIFVDNISNASDYYSQKNLNVIIHRSITSYTTYIGKVSFTISNLMGIIIVTFYSMSNEEEWINTRIMNGNGIINVEKQRIRSVIMEEINYWINEYESAKNNLSQNQENKIRKKIISLCNDIEKYPIFQDIINDKIKRLTNN